MIREVEDLVRHAFETFGLNPEKDKMPKKDVQIMVMRLMHKHSNYHCFN